MTTVKPVTDAIPIDWVVNNKTETVITVEVKPDQISFIELSDIDCRCKGSKIEKKLSDSCTIYITPSHQGTKLQITSKGVFEKGVVRLTGFKVFDIKTTTEKKITIRISWKS